MTWILVRKLLRDIRWALLVVCLILYVFSFIWVGIAKRVTTEIAPFFEIMAQTGGIDKELIEKVVFKGPGKISQAVLGGSDIRFERPNDFLAVEMLHPVVIILSCLWAVGRAAGAIAGEIERGTMELLMSQPVPRNRLIYAHFLVDLIVIPLICLSIIAGTQSGLATTGPFELDTSVFDEFPPAAKMILQSSNIPKELPVDASGQWFAAANLLSLIFAMSGVTMLISACGRNRWRSMGWAVLVFVMMFVINVIGQLWDSAMFLRPLTVFYYYQPQKIWLNQDWLVDLGDSWNQGQPLFKIPVLPLLLGIGMIGYGMALRVFTRRDLPAPL